MTPPPDCKGFRDRLLAAVARKTAVTKWLMTTQEWDFFLVVFGESHPAGHYFWHFTIRLRRALTADSVQMRNALRDVYVALDGAIGELLRVAGENTLRLPRLRRRHGTELQRLAHAQPAAGAHAVVERAERRMPLARMRRKTNPRDKRRRDLLATFRGLIPKSRSRGHFAHDSCRAALTRS